MEKIRNHNNNTHNTTSTNIKKIFWWLILWALLLCSCQESQNNKAQDSQKHKIETVWIETVWGDSEKASSIQEPWEYKIYKLWLGSIVPVKWDIQKAKIKIENTPELSKIQELKNIEFETILPSIIKESLMNNNAKSKSWAVGYLQLKAIAVKDTEKYFWIENLKLNVNNPIDNIILWSLYRIRSLNLIKGWLKTNLSDDDLEKMMILSYNAWPDRINSLFKESKATNYKSFEKYLAKKIWVKNKPIKKRDKTYWVDYIDPITDLDINSLQNKEYKKIAEGLRYVAIIDGISSYIKSNNTIKILWKVTHNKDKTLFSTVTELRNQWIFKKDSKINEICKIILETNWYSEKEIPTWIDLLLIKDALSDYLP